MYSFAFSYTEHGIIGQMPKSKETTYDKKDHEGDKKNNYIHNDI